MGQSTAVRKERQNRVKVRIECRSLPRNTANDKAEIVLKGRMNRVTDIVHTLAVKITSKRNRLRSTEPASAVENSRIHEAGAAGLKGEKK